MSQLALQQLSDDVYVCGQIQAADLASLHQQGFVSVICNRPDGESADQPTANEIQQAAQAVGIAFSYVPFAPANPSPTLLPDFTQALQAHSGKTLLYCRSGARCIRLYQATQA